MSTSELNRRNLFGCQDPDEKFSLAVGADPNEEALDLKQRTRDEIVDILKKAGVNYPNGKYEAVWLRAKELETTSPQDEVVKNTVSMRSVFAAIRELHYQ